MVPPDNAEAKVEACGTAGRGEHVAFIDMEHIGIRANVRITVRQQLGVAPVGRGTPSVQQPGCGEHEDARADGNQPPTTRTHAFRRLQEGPGRRFGRIPPTRNTVSARSINAGS